MAALLDLPAELLAAVVSHVTSVKVLYAIDRTCKFQSLQHAADEAWKRLALKDFPRLGALVAALQLGPVVNYRQLYYDQLRLQEPATTFRPSDDAIHRLRKFVFQVELYWRPDDDDDGRGHGGLAAPTWTGVPQVNLDGLYCQLWDPEAVPDWAEEIVQAANKGYSSDEEASESEEEPWMHYLEGMMLQIIVSKALPGGGMQSIALVLPNERCRFDPDASDGLHHEFIGFGSGPNIYIPCIHGFLDKMGMVDYRFTDDVRLPFMCPTLHFVPSDVGPSGRLDFDFRTMKGNSMGVEEVVAYLEHLVPWCTGDGALDAGVSGLESDSD